MAKKAKLNIDKIVNITWGDVDSRDHPDYVDAYVESAEYEYKPGKYRDLTDDEYDYVNDLAHEGKLDSKYADINNQLIGKAEYSGSKYKKGGKTSDEQEYYESYESVKDLHEIVKGHPGVTDLSEIEEADDQGIIGESFSFTFNDSDVRIWYDPGYQEFSLSEDGKEPTEILGTKLKEFLTMKTKKKGGSTYADGGAIEETKDNVVKLNNLLEKFNEGNIRFDFLHPKEIRPTLIYDTDSDEYIGLSEQIQENGVVPILVTDKKDGEYGIWDGNHRFEILTNLGVKNIPVYIYSGKEFEDWEQQGEFIETYANTSPLVQIDKGGSTYADGGKVTFVETPNSVADLSRDEIRTLFRDYNSNYKPEVDNYENNKRAIGSFAHDYKIPYNLAEDIVKKGHRNIMSGGYYADGGEIEDAFYDLPTSEKQKLVETFDNSIETWQPAEFFYDKNNIPIPRGLQETQDFFGFDQDFISHVKGDLPFYEGSADLGVNYASMSGEEYYEVYAMRKLLHFIVTGGGEVEDIIAKVWGEATPFSLHTQQEWEQLKRMESARVFQRNGSVVRWMYGLTEEQQRDFLKWITRNYEKAMFDCGGAVKADGGKITANKFKQIVKDAKDYLSTYPYIWAKGTKSYVPVEGWQYVGRLLGYSAKVVEVNSIDGQGWQAKAEIVNDKGMIVCSGFGLATKQEEKWAGEHEQPLHDFAQTKAVARAFANCIGDIIKAAGYQRTPAEEMYRVKSSKSKKRPTQPTTITGIPVGSAIPTKQWERGQEEFEKEWAAKFQSPDEKKSEKKNKTKVKARILNDIDTAKDSGDLLVKEMGLITDAENAELDVDKIKDAIQVKQAQLHAEKTMATKTTIKSPSDKVVPKTVQKWADKAIPKKKEVKKPSDKTTQEWADIIEAFWTDMRYGGWYWKVRELPTTQQVHYIKEDLASGTYGEYFKDEKETEKVAKAIKKLWDKDAKKVKEEDDDAVVYMKLKDVTDKDKKVIFESIWQKTDNSTNVDHVEYAVEDGLFTAYYGKFVYFEDTPKLVKEYFEWVEDSKMGAPPKKKPKTLKDLTSKEEAIFKKIGKERQWQKEVKQEGKNVVKAKGKHFRNQDVFVELREEPDYDRTIFIYRLKDGTLLDLDYLQGLGIWDEDEEAITSRLKYNYDDRHYGIWNYNLVGGDATIGKEGTIPELPGSKEEYKYITDAINHMTDPITAGKPLPKDAITKNIGGKKVTWSLDELADWNDSTSSSTEIGKWHWNTKKDRWESSLGKRKFRNKPIELFYTVGKYKDGSPKTGYLLIYQDPGSPLVVKMLEADYPEELEKLIGSQYLQFTSDEAKEILHKVYKMKQGTSAPFSLISSRPNPKPKKKAKKKPFVEMPGFEGTMDALDEIKVIKTPTKKKVASKDKEKEREKENIERKRKGRKTLSQSEYREWAKKANENIRKKAQKKKK